MRWNPILPSSRNSDPDYVSLDRQFRQSRRPAAAPSPKDIEQDAQLRLLREETNELKVYVATLVRVLQRRELISPQETAQLITMADRLHDSAAGLHSDGQWDYKGAAY